MIQKMQKWHILQGDALDVLKLLPNDSVHCICTSPPYWRQREYGIEGQIGKEKTLDEYVQRLTDIFRETRRVLKPDGTLWLNLGDVYNGIKGNRGGNNTFRPVEAYQVTPPGEGLICPNLKRKDLIGVPWHVAFSLQKDGWYLRTDIIWHRENCNKESVKDRPTRSHELIFLFSKSEKYYYDYSAFQEPAVTGGKRNKRTVWSVNLDHARTGGHVAPFPVKLIEPIIKGACPRDGIILDPFSGSGSTGLVSISFARRYIGIELSPEYLKLSQDRIFQKTGKMMSRSVQDVFS